MDAWNAQESAARIQVVIAGKPFVGMIEHSSHETR
jgi:hypothetical protein